MKSKPVVRVQFVWIHKGKGKRAKPLAQVLNKKARRKHWKGWSTSSVNSKAPILTEFREVLQAELFSLRGAGFQRLIGEVENFVVQQDVEVFIEGRRLLNYAIWADDQIRRLEQRLKDKDEVIRFALPRTKD